MVLDPNWPASWPTTTIQGRVFVGGRPVKGAVLTATPDHPRGVAAAGSQTLVIPAPWPAVTDDTGWVSLQVPAVSSAISDPEFVLVVRLNLGPFTLRQYKKTVRPVAGQVIELAQLFSEVAP